VIFTLFFSCIPEKNVYKKTVNGVKYIFPSSASSVFARENAMGRALYVFSGIGFRGFADYVLSGSNVSRKSGMGIKAKNSLFSLSEAPLTMGSLARFLHTQCMPPSPFYCK
jgi:hypothetical protein